MNSETLAFIGIFLGVLIRTLAPALRKWFEAREDGYKEFKWSHEYTATCIISLLVAIIVTMTVFQTFTIPEDGVNIVAAGFMFGFSMDAVINEVLKWLKTART